MGMTCTMIDRAGTVALLPGPAPAAAAAIADGDPWLEP